MSSFTESVVEEAALEWLQSAGWQIAHGPDIAIRGAQARVLDFDDPANND